MWDDQIRRVDDLVVVQNQIEIERARRAGIWAGSATSLLDVEQHTKQVVRRERRLPHCGGGQEDRLVTHTDGSRVVEAGKAEGLNVRPQRVERGTEIAFAIAEIAAERDGDRWNRGYSCQRVGSTSPTRSAPAVRRPMTSSRPAAACSKRR